jgi:hypothetical protein
MYVVMALNVPTKLVERVAAPQHFLHPTPREMRAQSVHRLQVGLLGLCCMLLLIALASVIMTRARISDAENAAHPGSSTNSEKMGAGDPLADIGVTPSASASASRPEPKQ